MKKIYFAVLVTSFLGGSLYAMDQSSLLIEENQKNQNEALFFAVMNDHIEFAQWLLSKGAYVNVTYNTIDGVELDGIGLLHIAAFRNNSNMAHFLLTNSVNPNCSDINGAYAEDYTEDELLKLNLHNVREWFDTRRK